jgi:hypothetical protein
VWAVVHYWTATVHDYEEVAFPRLFGVYSTRARARAAADRARAQRGFDGRLGDVDEAEPLRVERWPVDDPAWVGGFFSYDAEGREE